MINEELHYKKGMKSILEKYLYFGTFVSVLCSQRKKDSQEMAIGTLVSILDERNACCHVISREKEIIDDGNFNKTQISRVRRGIVAFDTSEWCKVDSIEFEEVLNEIKTWASDYYYDLSCKERIILAIYDIIKDDVLIEVETNAVFKKYFGMSKEEFLANETINFYDLVSRTLLYTFGVTINNKVQKICQKQFHRECESYMMKLQRKYINTYYFDAENLIWV